MRQSFADIARASSDHLQTLPGFGPVKVRRIKDAFDRPFRNRATSAVFSVGSQVPLGVDDVVVSASTGKKFPEVAGPAASGSKALPVLPADSAPVKCGVKDKAKELAPMRGQSAVWNLDSPPLTTSSGPPSRRPREPSPVWDIELDLNEDDLYEDADPRLTAKKGFRQAGSPLGSDE